MKGPDYAKAAERLAAEAQRKLRRQLGREPTAAEVWWLTRVAMQDGLGCTNANARMHSARAAEQLLGPIPSWRVIDRLELAGYRFVECQFVPGAYGWELGELESAQWFPTLLEAVDDAAKHHQRSA